MIEEKNGGKKKKRRILGSIKSMRETKVELTGLGRKKDLHPE